MKKNIHTEGIFNLKKTTSGDKDSGKYQGPQIYLTSSPETMTLEVYERGLEAIFASERLEIESMKMTPGGKDNAVHSTKIKRDGGSLRIDFRDIDGTFDEARKEKLERKLSNQYVASIEFNTHGVRIWFDEDWYVAGDITEGEVKRNLFNPSLYDDDGDTYLHYDRENRLITVDRNALESLLASYSIRVHGMELSMERNDFYSNVSGYAGEEEEFGYLVIDYRFKRGPADNEYNARMEEIQLALQALYIDYVEVAPKQIEIVFRDGFQVEME